jgi:hypothetical protein
MILRCCFLAGKLEFSSMRYETGHLSTPSRNFGSPVRLDCTRSERLNLLRLASLTAHPFIWRISGCDISSVAGKFNLSRVLLCVAMPTAVRDGIDPHNLHRSDSLCTAAPFCVVLCCRVVRSSEQSCTSLAALLFNGLSKSPSRSVSSVPGAEAARTMLTRPSGVATAPTHAPSGGVGDLQHVSPQIRPGTCCNSGLCP